MRVGMGYDVHRLVEGRKLILGGVEIPHTLGLLGHSDADVLVHAVMDALLGAAALRDIGRHFPDNDPAYEGASSIELLRRVGKMLEERMYLIENIDATVIAQQPKLLPYIDRMVENIADALKLETDQTGNNTASETLVYSCRSGLNADVSEADGDSWQPYREAEEEIELYPGLGVQEVYDMRFQGFGTLVLMTGEDHPGFSLDTPDARGVEVD